MNTAKIIAVTQPEPFIRHSKMSNEEMKEILDWQRKQKEFHETELGALFNKFVNAHGSAWREDERSGWMENSGKTAKRLWAESDELEKKLRLILMDIAGVK